jgi:hypothetical protein
MMKTSLIVECTRGVTARSILLAARICRNSLLNELAETHAFSLGVHDYWRWRDSPPMLFLKHPRLLKRWGVGRRSAMNYSSLFICPKHTN